MLSCCPIAFILLFWSETYFVLISASNEILFTISTIPSYDQNKSFLPVFYKVQLIWHNNIKVYGYCRVSTNNISSWYILVKLRSYMSHHWSPYENYFIRITNYKSSEDQFQYFTNITHYNLDDVWCLFGLRLPYELNHNNQNKQNGWTKNVTFLLFLEDSIYYYVCIKYLIV